MSVVFENSSTRHIPILLDPITDFLVEGLTLLPDSAPAGVILDCTLGGGGHSARLLQKMEQYPKAMKHRIVGVDQDLEAIARDQIRFKEALTSKKIEIHHSPFSRALDVVQDRPLYGVLADLGISSDQIDSESRGFSFRFDSPLDMRMNKSKGVSLEEYLMDVSETELADVLWKYGEERFSRKIARKLIDHRSKNTLPKTTKTLAEMIASSFPPALRHKGIHPATKSFQALRIELNQELKELETLLEKILPHVATGGHIAILSFHSLEDRLVKTCLRNKDLFDLPTRKAIQADDQEVDDNSRSRSAKLRFAIRK